LFWVTSFPEERILGNERWRFISLMICPSVWMLHPYTAKEGIKIT
jgi:hypothetical protein